MASTVEDLESAASKGDEAEICGRAAGRRRRPAVRRAAATASTAVTTPEGHRLRRPHRGVGADHGRPGHRAREGRDRASTTACTRSGSSASGTGWRIEIVRASRRYASAARTGARSTRGSRPSGSAPTTPVVAVPGDGALEAVGEADLRLPAQRAHLVGAQRVAAVVARAVGDVLDELLAGARELEDPPDDLDVRALVGTADVVDLARARRARGRGRCRARSPRRRASCGRCMPSP